MQDRRAARVEEKHVDTTSLKVMQLMIEDLCDEQLKKSPEEIHAFLETIDNPNMRNFIEKEILRRMGEKSEKL